MYGVYDMGLNNNHSEQNPGGSEIVSMNLCASDEIADSHTLRVS